MPTCEPTTADDPAVATLTAEVIREYGVRYGDPHDDIAPPADDATWVVVRDDDGSAVGCGAVQPWWCTVAEAPPDVGELKRMYVRPAARGRGLSRRLLDRLVELAGERGMTALVLETGIEQPEAIGLYTTYGFRLMHTWGPYADDPRSRCFRLDISGAA